ncbi:SH3 domain-containing protein [Treponema brennaborense]|uniref:SH3 type 3 domain protein n=1 Tax=Treponema brennaborense (strain DSM 12168 / CIP 105900 / DD5/3) TaxID=906968 RepID=F4LJF2_TREBD|nr:SH3 domain-containing protein [Treponema brennaborense]AEE17397.1 SH3 type 3 domain protein [Treponema brennaborense DSM 12168]
MVNKKLLFCVFQVLSSIYMFSNPVLDGTWIDSLSYIWHLKSPEKNENLLYEDYSWGKAKNEPNTTMDIDIANNMISDATLWGFSIRNIEYKGKSKIILNVSRYVEAINNYWDLELIIHFIDDDTFWIENEWLENNWDSFAGPNILRHRISGPAKIPLQNAILSDSRVRIRTKPNLQSDTWGFLNKGDRVEIKDKSDEPFEINGEKWYWYKVDAEGYPDGWVYGKYLDIEN